MLGNLPHWYALRQSEYLGIEIEVALRQAVPQCTSSSFPSLIRSQIVIGLNRSGCGLRRLGPLPILLQLNERGQPGDQL
jgi:hypothetical protein